MTSPLAFLQDNERLALAEYAGRVLSSAGSRVQNVILFGSKARGDSGPDSDLDVLVVIDHYDAQIDDVVTMTASRISLEFDTLINTHLVAADRWAKMQKWEATLWQEVQRDGVSLLPELVPA